jgi:hypothetical protein
MQPFSLSTEKVHSAGSWVIVSNCHKASGSHRVLARMYMQSCLTMTKPEFEKLNAEEKLHYYECAQCGEMVDKRQLDEVLFHELFAGAMCQKSMILVAT